MSFGRYIGLSLWVTALFLFLSAITAVTIDPYGIYRIVDIEGFNAKKPRAFAHRDYAKHFQYARVKPTTVIVGNSRMEIGLDPASNAWPANAAPVYNFGLGGYGLNAWSRALSSMVITHKPGLVIAGMDFHEYAMASEGSKAIYRVPSRPVQRLEQLAKFAETTLSIAAIRHSATTILDQDVPNILLHTRLGFIPVTTSPEAAEDLHQNLMYSAAAVNLVANLASGSLYQMTSARWRGARGIITDLLEWCHDNDVELLLVIYPGHADFLEVLRVSGLWPAYEDWLRETTELVADYHRRYPDWRLELWDFGGYSRYATETVPTARDPGSRMTWHLNPGHFTPKLGDQIIKRLFRDPSADMDFGIRLEPANLENHIERLNRDHREYHARQPRDIERIARAYEQVHGVKPPEGY